MITVRIDDRVRLVSSVLSLTKHFGGIYAWAHSHPLRVATQNFLAEFKEHPCIKLFDEIAEHRFINAFYGLVVLCTFPPELKWKNEGGPSLPEDDPLKEKIIGEFPSLLSKFFADTNISDLWKQRNKDWEATVDQCKPVLSLYNVDTWMLNFYGESQLKLILVPNPTDPCSLGYGPSTGNEKYAVIGLPCVSKQMKVTDDDFSYSKDPKYVVRIVFHEFSHGILGNILRASKDLVNNTKFLSARNKLKGYFPSTYPTWDVQLEEILIRACTALFISETENEARAKEFLDEEKRNCGIFLVDDIYFGLKRYIKAKETDPSMSLTDYLPKLFEFLKSPKE